LNAGFQFLVREGSAGPELLRALDLLCEKVGIMSTTDDPYVWMKHIGPFSEDCIEFEYLLLQAPETPITAMSDFEAISECTRIAALSFFYGLNEERPSESGIIQSLGAQLQSRLQLINFTRCLESYGEALLWIVFGGSYRVRGLTRKWFAELLPAVYFQLGIDSWDACFAIFRKFLWLDKIAQPSQDLWILSRKLM
jgi:hypothetical protein